MLNYVCIAFTQVSRYYESRYFLSPLVRFSGVLILIPCIRLDIFDDVSAVIIPVIVSPYCGSGVLPRSVCFLILLTFFGLHKLV